MKKMLMLLLALALAIAAAAGSAETVSQLDYDANNSNNYFHIVMSDGYIGYDVQCGHAVGGQGTQYTVTATDAGGLMLKPIDNSAYAAQQIKRLFVEHYDKVIENLNEADGLRPWDVQMLIWHLSSKGYTLNSEQEKMANVLKSTASGAAVIPDHGHEKKLDETTTVIFDFEGLDSINAPEDIGKPEKEINNLFAFKLSYRVTGKAGGSATLSVPQMLAGAFQWQEEKDGTFVDIPGATERSYTIRDLRKADDGRKFRCVCTHARPYSSEKPTYDIDVTLTVTGEDTAAPETNLAGSLPKTGDPSMLGAWAALLSASAMGLRKMKKKS